MEIWNRLILVLDKFFLRWIFPPICIHCHDVLDQNCYFCQGCLQLVDHCFLYREDPRLCKRLQGKSLCIAFETLGPLYALSCESHPRSKKLFAEFVKLVYLQSPVFKCNGIIYCDSTINFRAIAYIAKVVGKGLSLPVYKLSKVPKNISRPLLLCWQLPDEKEIKQLETTLRRKSIRGAMDILVLFDQFN